jgi:hypothetical protein
LLNGALLTRYLHKTLAEITAREKSPGYSQVFDIAFLSQLPPSSIQAEHFPECPSFLSGMPSILPPPPFVPSHPVFRAISEVAESRSREIRQTAEVEFADFAKKKLVQIEEHESLIRQQVEALWTQYKAGIQTTEEESISSVPRSPPSRSRAMVASAETHTNSPPPSTAHVSVRNFVPVAFQPVHNAPSVPPARISTLSASLRETAFVAPPRGKERSASPPSDTPLVPSPRSAMSLGSASSATLTVKPQAYNGSGAGTLRQFRPNFDDNINTAASYRYFLDLDEEMAKKKEAEAATNGSDVSAQAGPSSKKPQRTTREAKGESSSRDLKNGTQDTPSKGKKVTFNIQPQITIPGPEPPSNARDDSEGL